MTVHVTFGGRGPVGPHHMFCKAAQRIKYHMWVKSTCPVLTPSLPNPSSPRSSVSFVRDGNANRDPIRYVKGIYYRPNAHELPCLRRRRRRQLHRLYYGPRDRSFHPTLEPPPQSRPNPYRLWAAPTTRTTMTVILIDIRSFSAAYARALSLWRGLCCY